MERRVKGEFRDAGEKCARLQDIHSSSAANALQHNSENFLDRIRILQRDIRLARSSAPSSLVSGHTSPQGNGSVMSAIVPSTD